MVQLNTNFFWRNPIFNFIETNMASTPATCLSDFLSLKCDAWREAKYYHIISGRDKLESNPDFASNPQGFAI